MEKFFLTVFLNIFLFVASLVVIGFGIYLILWGSLLFQHAGFWVGILISPMCFLGGIYAIYEAIKLNPLFQYLAPYLKSLFSDSRNDGDSWIKKSSGTSMRKEEKKISKTAYQLGQVALCTGFFISILSFGFALVIMADDGFNYSSDKNFIIGQTISGISFMILAIVGAVYVLKYKKQQKEQPVQTKKEISLNLNFEPGLLERITRPDTESGSTKVVKKTKIVKKKETSGIESLKVPDFITKIDERSAKMLKYIKVFEQIINGDKIEFLHDPSSKEMLHLLRKALLAQKAEIEEFEQED